ncbi:GMC oxidoreductase family protein [Cryptosporidium serpentis]
MKIFEILFICLIASADLIACIYHQNYNEILPNNDYDVIIIGAGASGCVMANIYANKGLKVLLLERGGPRSEHPTTLYTSGVPGVITDESVSEAITTSNGTLLNVANIIGGGTSINGGFYVQPSFNFMKKTIERSEAKFDEEVYNEAINIIQSSPLLSKSNKLDGNFPKSLFEYISQMPDFKNSNPNPSYTAENNSVFVTVSEFHGNIRNSADVLLSHENIQILPYSVVESISFNVTEDNHDPYSLKKKISADCIMGKMRSERDGYISINSGKTHRTLYYNSGPKFRICIKKPNSFIMLAAGAVHSPAILMRSGVGPTDIMNKYGIQPMKILEQVGRNYHDHLQFGLFGILKNQNEPISIQKIYGYSNCTYYIPDPPTLEDELKLFHYNKQCNYISKHHHKYNNSTVNKQNFDSLFSPVINFPFLGDNNFISDTPNINGNSRCYSTILDEVSGGLWAPFAISQIMYRKGKQTNNPLLTYLAINMREKILDAVNKNSTVMSDANFNILLNPIQECLSNGAATISFITQPKSRGYITLDKDGLPEIKSADFADQSDIEAAIVAMKNIIDIMTSDMIGNLFQEELDSCILPLRNMWNSFSLFSGVEASLINTVQMQRIIPAFIPPIPSIINDETIFELVKESYSTIWHPTGTCALGSVVDGNFTIRGISNLKIGDASIFPEISDVSPLGSVLLMAAYVALKTSGN